MSMLPDQTPYSCPVFTTVSFTLSNPPATLLSHVFCYPLTHSRKEPSLLQHVTFHILQRTPDCLLSVSFLLKNAWMWVIS